MVFFRLLFLVLTMGIFNAFVLSWGIVDISQLYQIPYLKEFTLWNIMGLAILKGVLEGNSKLEIEKKRTVSEERVSVLTEADFVKDITLYFLNRMIMIAASVGIAHVIHWIYL